MALRVVTPAKGTIVTLAEAKAHCRVDANDEDDFIEGLILDAGELLEAETQRRFLTQTLEWVRECWDDPMVLPIAGPTDSSSIAIGAITYTALDGTTQTLDPSLYWDRAAGQTRKVVRRWFVIWPWLGDGAERVVIRFTVTGTAVNTPRKIKRAALLLISHWYRNRDAVVGVDARDSSTELPLGVEALVSGERWA